MWRSITNWDLAGCLRRRRLAFPTGKVARPLAVTDESQNAAYFLQPNWNGSIVHPPAHKQSRFQLARLAARATLPAREGKCALRAQDAHLYKSQFFVSFSGRGAQRRLYLVPNVRNALAAGLARQIPIYWTKLSTVNCQFDNAQFFQTIGYAPVIDTIVHRTL